jgi:hypothetical protein
MASNFGRNAISGPLLITRDAAGTTVLETMVRSGIPITGDADANPYSDGITRVPLIVGTDLVTGVGGQKFPFLYLQQNIATSQASVVMKISDVAAVTQYVMPFAGSIIGIAARGNAAITTSTIRFTPAVNGVTVTGMAAQNSVTGVRSITKTQAKDVAGSTFSAGDALSVKVVTTASYAPATIDWTCVLVVEA